MTEVHSSHSLGGEATSYYTAVHSSASPPSKGFFQLCIKIPNSLKKGLAGRREVLFILKDNTNSL